MHKLFESAVGRAANDRRWPRTMARTISRTIYFAVLVLMGCAGVPAPGPAGEAAAFDAAQRGGGGKLIPSGKAGAVDESAMLPLLNDLQRIQRMTAQELLRERNVLAATAPTPSAHLRMAGVLGQSRGPLDLARALTLLDAVLKANDSASLSVHPLARILAASYQERQKLQMQNDKLTQQLGESVQHSTELQEKLDALTAIERSLPVRPPGENLPGSAR